MSVKRGRWSTAYITQIGHGLSVFGTVPGIVAGSERMLGVLVGPSGNLWITEELAVPAAIHWSKGQFLWDLPTLGNA